MKKVSELSTLCSDGACIIVYDLQELQPEAVWPTANVAARMIAHLRTLSKMEQCKKMVDQTGFLRQQEALKVSGLSGLEDEPEWSQG